MKADYTIARRHLMKADPQLNLIIKRVGPCQLHAAAPRDPFEALCMSIASQQLSVRRPPPSSAGSAICSRSANPPLSV